MTGLWKWVVLVAVTGLKTLKEMVTVSPILVYFILFVNVPEGPDHPFVVVSVNVS